MPDFQDLNNSLKVIQDSIEMPTVFHLISLILFIWIIINDTARLNIYRMKCSSKDKKKQISLKFCLSFM